MTARANQLFTHYTGRGDFTNVVTDPYNMPRAAQKRKAGGEIEAALSFADRYCRSNGIPCDIGSSFAEQECNRIANEAREQFKLERDSDPTSAADEISDRNGLTASQKYSIRLRNNRKSANAARVFSEVLKRKQSDYLRKVQETNQSNHYQTIIKSLKQQVDELRQENKRFATELEVQKGTDIYEKSRTVYLEEQNKELRGRVEQLQNQLKQQNHHVRNDNNIDSSNTNHDDEQNRSYKQENQSSPLQSQPSQSVAIHFSAPLPSLGSQPALTQTPQNSQQNLENPLQTDSQNQQENIPPGSQSLYYRISSARYSSGYNASWGDMPMSLRNDSEGKEFHTGLTCSQSQNEDTPEDKGSLMRGTLGSIPVVSTPLQAVGLLSSQQSQELTPFKPFSSDDLAMAPESELFGGSQGTSKGRNS